MLSNSLKSSKRTFVSTLFGITFFASMLTVSASNLLPCPARTDKSRFADSDMEQSGRNRNPVKVAKRPHRWIEEKQPS
ncbi:hypothetical protein M378DRAFT_72447 [Amanita muscaria Koide BX008]|uniref:Uncharacterized protein n=1 Tax=Amanita muscaria (strain Koide BX008) TaxID=946122 RepID=A0A0C2X1Y3_AMAMK|nr:hypothetical protein M378DRAFT_72447 [Amanita muscaria Koide BX008]